MDVVEIVLQRTFGGPAVQRRHGEETEEQHGRKRQEDGKGQPEIGRARQAEHGPSPSPARALSLGMLLTGSHPAPCRAGKSAARAPAARAAPMVTCRVWSSTVPRA